MWRPQTIKISIADEVREICPSVALGVLGYRANVEPSSGKLLGDFELELERLFSAYTLESIAQNSHIAATRQAYKTLGKSPHEYRNAAEAMLRRIVKGAGLYRINNVVDVNNYISTASGYSIGSYDVSRLRGDIELRRAGAGACYDGIGKGSVNIEHLPVLYDEQGPFGNPSSDSRRAMVQSGEREICSVFYAFDGREGLEPWMERFSGMLEKYCDVCEIEAWTV